MNFLGQFNSRCSIPNILQVRESNVKSEIVHERILFTSLLFYNIINVFAYARITHDSFCTSLAHYTRYATINRDPRKRRSRARDRGLRISPLKIRTRIT